MQGEKGTKASEKNIRRTTDREAVLKTSVCFAYLTHNRGLECARRHLDRPAELWESVSWRDLSKLRDTYMINTVLTTEHEQPRPVIVLFWHFRSSLTLPDFQGFYRKGVTPFESYV